MTITNREFFHRDPTDTKIPNDGVAKVVRPDTEQQWDVLRWQLAGQGVGSPRHQVPERDAHAVGDEAARLQHRLARWRSRVHQSGTPPDQAPDADLTRRDVSTDLFAVGVALYKLLCNGQHPYPGSKPMVGEGVIDPRIVRPDLSDDLAELLIRACASYRSERFTTAREMKDSLPAIRSGIGSD